VADFEAAQTDFRHLRTVQGELELLLDAWKCDSFRKSGYASRIASEILFEVFPERQILLILRAGTAQPIERVH
jgi:hypothetical protein